MPLLLSLKGVWLLILASLYHIFHTFTGLFLNFLLFGLSSVDLSVAFVKKDVSVPQSSLWFLVGLVPVCPCLFCWRGQNWTENADGVSPSVRGRITPLHLLSIVAEWPQGAVGLLYHRCTLLTYAQLAAHQEHQGLFWIFQLPGSSSCLCSGLFLGRCRTLFLSPVILVSLIMIFYSHTSHSCQISAKPIWFICDESRGPSRICFPSQGHSCGIDMFGCFFFKLFWFCLD